MNAKIKQDQISTIADLKGDGPNGGTYYYAFFKTMETAPDGTISGIDEGGDRPALPLA